MVVAVEVVADVAQVVLPLMSEEPAALGVSLLSLRADRRAQVAEGVVVVETLIQPQLQVARLQLVVFMAVVAVEVETQTM
jgi:hypothetical protein